MSNKLMIFLSSLAASGTTLLSPCKQFQGSFKDTGDLNRILYLFSTVEMVDAVIGFVLGRMGDYLIKDASMLFGIKDELEELKTELTCIQGYLKDVEAREREDEASKAWAKLVLDIAYDIEDVLDSYHLKAKKRSHRRCLMRLTNKVGKMKDSYNILDEFKILKRRILDVTRKRETYGIGNINEPRGEGGHTSSLRVNELRRTRSVDYEEFVVGLEDHAKILLGKLLDDRENKRLMISIFGMGGLGKTAIARKLYNFDDVKRRFEYRAWTYVSQEYNTRDMLMRIIRSLGVASVEELERIKDYAEEQLEVYLRGLLEGKRYLVVVDDIWEADAWQSLKRALPCDHVGSRVIITTRIRAVTECVDGRVYDHELRFLTFEESWKLFEQKAFKNMEQVDEDLLKNGKDMVQKCGGLPLAIVVLAGFLFRKRANEWHEACDSFWRRLKNNNSSHVSTVFDLSFKEMRQELKLCFLYLSVFPEDYEINVEKLIHLLVAEGFIPHGTEMMMEDEARYYIEELIDRSLVRAENIERGKVVSFKIHDLLRDLAIKKSKELNFINVYNDQHPSTTCRREVVHNLMNESLCDRRVNKRMRSLLFFGESETEMPLSCFEFKLKLLRVLNLEGYHWLPDVLGELIQLRYLAVTNTSLEKLPEFISKLQLLQTLDVRGYSRCKGKIDLRKLTALRHVIGKFAGELLIGDAGNLQTLKFISCYSWSKLKHESLRNLWDLEIVDCASLDGGHVDWASFTKLKNLRVLKLQVTTFKISSESEEAVRLRDEIFPSLESLTLVGTTLKEDPMPALEKLPKLEYLLLENCKYTGANMRITAEGFARLKKLELFMIVLAELRMEEGAMPCLTKLNVTYRLGPTKLLIPDRFLSFARCYHTVCGL